MYTIAAWGDVFTASLQNLWLGVASVLPGLLGGIIIFLIGWAVGSVVGKAIAQVFSAIKIDTLFEKMGVYGAFSRAGIKLSVGGLIGGLVKWFLIVVFLMAALEVVGLSQVNFLLAQVVVGYLPRVIVAALVLVIATVVSDVVGKIISGGAAAANVKSANMLGTVAHYAIWIFAIIIALSTLGIAPALLQILFSGIIAMLAIAGGLAFGLGGKDAAAKAIEKIKGDMSM